MKEKIAFESEHIIVDQDNTPINNIKSGPFGLLGETQTSDKIIHILENRYPGIKKSGGISKELDACQIEIRNTKPCQSINEAQDELCGLYVKVEDVVKNDLGLKLLDGAVPKQDFEPITSRTEKCHYEPPILGGGFTRIYTEIKERYKVINNKLRSIGLDTRKATNIAGIHFHIDADENDGFKNHQIISSTVKKIYKKDKSKLLLSKERDIMMKKVVLGLNKLGFLKPDSVLSGLEPIDFIKLLDSLGENIDIKKEIKQILLDTDGNPRFSYNYVTLKKPGGYTTEIRTPDGVGTINGLIESTTKIYELIVKDILEK